MKKDDIHLVDWQRILLGEAPPVFLFEVLIRTIITYVVLLAVMKFLGKRMSGKLSNTETAVTLMFGAVVSSGMQIPDRGILESVFILLLILLLQRGYTLWTVRSRKQEKFTLGTTSLMVKDGVIQTEFMKKELLSKYELFRTLRAKSYLQLGEVKRVYMEPNGSFTIIKKKEPVPGMAVLPPDEELISSLLEERDDEVVCEKCGKLYKKAEWKNECDNCHNDTTVAAMTQKQHNG